MKKQWNSIGVLFAASNIHFAFSYSFFICAFLAKNICLLRQEMTLMKAPESGGSLLSRWVGVCIAFSLFFMLLMLTKRLSLQ